MTGRPRRADLVGHEVVRQWVRLSDQTARSIARHAAAEGISAAAWIARAARRDLIAAEWIERAARREVDSLPTTTTPEDSQ